MDQQYSGFNYMEYISENIFGLILLVFAFFIIYFVDHINQLNAALMLPSLSVPIAGLHNSAPMNVIKNIKNKNKNKKNKS
jgi:hypothetical protein